jgi:hypothetical protein
VALRNRSKSAMHSLRIGIRRFRYIVENFLPDLYEDWHRNLKKLQDALGEVHDLDVLSETARSLHVYENPQQRQHWTTLIQRERKQRVDTYREKMLGKQSLWLRWRAELPQGEALHAAVLKNFETWAQFRDPNVAHTQRVLAIALAVFDQLEDPGSYDSVALRDLLSVAVLAHEVARGRGKHHKKSVRLLDKLEPPPEWKPVHLHLAGMIARYHRGAMPRESQRTFATLSAEEKNIVVLLGGIIRLADALDYARNGATGEIQIKKSDTAWVILASGLDAQTKAAEALSSARFLFENVIGLPVAVLGR